MTSPTARSLQKLRDEGWTAAVVEKWISYRDAKLDEKLWELVGDLLAAEDLLVLDSESVEKQFRVAAAFYAIRELRKRYKPPVMPGVRKDLFGFGDILAFRGPELMIVQATSFANLNSRIVKAQRLDAFCAWVGCGRRVEFHGWRVRKLKTGDGSMCKVVRFPKTGREDIAGAS